MVSGECAWWVEKPFEKAVAVRDFGESVRSRRERTPPTPAMNMM